MRTPAPVDRFAELYRLRAKRDDCGERIIRGKLGHLYAHDASRFGIVLEAPRDNARSDKTLCARKRRATAAGFVVHQEGDFEAVLLFEPGDGKQALLAIKLIDAKKIRRVAGPTEAQLRARALFSSKARSSRPRFHQNTDAAVVQASNSYESPGAPKSPAIAIPGDGPQDRKPKLNATKDSRNEAGSIHEESQTYVSSKDSWRLKLSRSSVSQTCTHG
jgi:hypothetical protein